MMKHPPGCHEIDGRTYFTLYAPFAQKVKLLLFEKCDDVKPADILPMRAVSGGFWEYTDIRDFNGYYYAFKLDDHDEPVADPYSLSVSTFNDFHQKAKGYICNDPFDWEDDRYMSHEDPRKMVIYEAHVKDMTAHPSAGSTHPGTYAGLIDKIPYLKELGVNAIELLPIQHFANYEPPYEEAAQYIQNTWNPYAYNHWGYMTAYFFAPANFYSLGGTKEKGTWSDPRGQEITELKALVKALHKNGISVIMDVVYNHISQYNFNPLRALAEQHYIDPHANTSGCGNDVRSSSPVMKRLITDSVRYWMEEFHIDGFRFDLAGVLDDDTLSAIKRTTKSINPNVVLVGEPWGKRYFPQRMSDLEYGVWNDVYRNGIKGENPLDRPGFIFGQWDHHLNKNNFTKLLTGSLRKDGGLVPDSRFTVNYLESHDGYTLGDFIRIASRKTVKATSPENEEHQSLTDKEKAVYKLGMFMLACSQGIMMIHSGQEFARSKVVRKEEDVVDPSVGEMDHDSYNKDNATNYINYDEIKFNEDIFDYVKNLISLRHFYPELSSADRKQITGISSADNELGLGYLSRSSDRTVAVLVNGSQDKTALFKIDEGTWSVHANMEHVSVDTIGTMNGGTVVLSPCSCYCLIKNNS